MKKNILGLRISTSGQLGSSTPNIFMHCATPSVQSPPTEMFPSILQARLSDEPRSAGLTRQFSPNARTIPKALKYLNLSPAKGTDRFIPSRVHNDFELSNHNLVGEAPATLLSKNPAEAQRRSPVSKDILLFNKVLRFSSPKRTTENHDKIKLNLSPRESKIRRLPTSADNVLDAPGIANNFFLNAIDWGSSGLLAAALESRVYIWNPETQDTKVLFECEIDNEMSGVRWNKDGSLLVLSMRNGLVKVWDKEKKCIEVVTKHKEYVTALTWNHRILSSGDAMGNVHHTDVLKGSSSTIKIKITDEIVSGLAWAPNGKYLAVGISNGTFELWEGFERRLVKVSNYHVAAIKGIAWCPWNSRIFVTGGGLKDQKIRIWTMEKYIVSSIEDFATHTEETHSQVCDIVWPKNRKEIITCHSAPDFKIAFWKYPSLAPLGEIKGHLDRVLSMTISNCGQLLVSASADETIRLWKCFPSQSKDDHKQKHILGISIR